MAVTTRSHAFRYHVSLSFRGPDTRYDFTGHLYDTLRKRGINTFIDDEKLQRGEEITPALKKAIEESMIAIITVLSKDYASSSFCLDEFSTILHCTQNKGMLVIPVFYKVDPSDVRHHKGTYGKTLAKHKKRFPEKLQKWKTALCKVANLSGYHLKDGDEYEYKFIEKIVKHVSMEINRVPLHVADYPVGLKPQVLQVRKLLDVGSDVGVCMIGIHGMGRVGKSTLVGAVYNDLIIAENFDGLCFLENVREKSSKNGLEHLQSIILSKILREKDINITSCQEGATMIHDRLQRMKVLLVLDDVDKLKQLQELVGRLDWFGPGSIIIITTRDKQLLASHKVKRRYKVKELNENDALQLLTWKAFEKEKADPRYEKVLNLVVKYASGLPLALVVIGSSLVGKSIEDWESAIEKYKRIPENDILEILKVSFDSLGEEDKSVFLDIACCFKGCKLTEVEDILCAHYGHSVKHHIGVLVEKSLIKRSEGKVTLHDLIEDMGKEIVRQQSPKQPGKRSRLWSHEDIRKVLEDNMGTSEIEMICLDFPLFEEEIDWDGNAFKEMTNLKTLVIRNGEFSKCPDYFPKSLRVLEWHGYPSNCFPSNFIPKELCICKLPDSCFTSFVLDGLSKKFQNLTVLNFDKCEFLTQIPDVSDLQILKELSFKKCTNLTTVHDSIGVLNKLQILSAEGCSRLTSFPSLKLTSLERLELSHCTSLEHFPEIVGEMENIKELELRDLPIKELPVSFQNLNGLRTLILECGIVELRSSILLMPELSLFLAMHCKGWQWVKSEDGEEKVGSIVSPKVDWVCARYCNLNDDFFSIGFTWFAHVEKLAIPGNNLTFLPECFKEFCNLYHLDVRNCKHLKEIRGIPPNLKYFDAGNCISLTSWSTNMFLSKELHEAQETKFLFPGTCIPEWFNHKSRGPSSSFWFRNKFPAKVLCLLIAPVFGDVYAFVQPMVFINGKVQEFRWSRSDKSARMLELDHTYLFDLQAFAFENNLSEVAWEKVWNHVEVTYPGVLAREKELREEGALESPLIKATGIHIFKQEKATMEDDIRFDDPYTNTKLDDDDLSSSESQNHSWLESIG